METPHTMTVTMIVLDGRRSPRKQRLTDASDVPLHHAAAPAEQRSRGELRLDGRGSGHAGAGAVGVGGTALATVGAGAAGPFEGLSVVALRGAAARQPAQEARDLDAHPVIASAPP
eukprot:3923425-Rhodomonas_salina.1